MNQVCVSSLIARSAPDAGFFTRALQGANPAYRELVRRNAIGLIPYGVCIVLIVFAIHRGLCDARPGWWLCIGMAGTAAAFHMALRSGWSQRFKDPSLSFAGVLVAMSWTVLVYVFGGALQATQLLFLGLTMGVSVFYMNASGIRLACAYGVVTMGGAIITMAQLAPDRYPPQVAYLYLILLAMCMPILMAVGMQRVKLTQKLNRQKTDLSDALARLKEIAIRDELTGVYNRSHMIERMQHAVDRQLRTGEQFALVMVDLDHFKRVNDSYGHGVGDDVLRSFATVASALLRKSDILARWGGEEFVAICPHTDEPNAVVGIERLLKEWSQTQVSEQVPQLRVSFSAGIATYQVDETIESALNRADQALYEAKAKGRNCIVCR